jgi:hypothetical protein
VLKAWVAEDTFSSATLDQAMGSACMPKQGDKVGAQSEICDRSVFIVAPEIFDRLMAEAESPPRALENAKRRFARLARDGVRP